MNLVERAKNIIMTPKTEWAVIASEEPNANGIFMGYALPLILLSAAAAFIGHGFIWGSHYGLGGFGGSAISWGIYSAVMVVVAGVLGVWLTAMIVNALAPSFGSEKNMGRAMQLVVYSYTPAWIGGLLMIYPPLGFIGSLFGIYGLYLIYLGLPHTMKTPADKVVTYMVISIVAIVVIYFVVAAIFAGIFLSIFGLGLASTVNFRM